MVSFHDLKLYYQLKDDLQYNDNQLDHLCKATDKKGLLYLVHTFPQHD